MAPLTRQKNTAQETPPAPEDPVPGMCTRQAGRNAGAGTSDIPPPPTAACALLAREIKRGVFPDSPPKPPPEQGQLLRHKPLWRAQVLISATSFMQVPMVRTQCEGRIRPVYALAQQHRHNGDDGVSRSKKEANFLIGKQQEAMCGYTPYPRGTSCTLHQLDAPSNTDLHHDHPRHSTQPHFPCMQWQSTPQDFRGPIPRGKDHSSCIPRGTSLLRPSPGGGRTPQQLTITM
ncbi:hypothetical protein DFH09DRAFT_1086438 [Mycena vulgaris]|nr:hypothetical protein DFH09DRAFT_1086438 [Mycena vulgaris]